MNNNDEVVKKSIGQEIAKATVNILVDGQPKGTGFFITPDGYVLTAYHCIGAWPPEIRVKTASGEHFIARLDEEKTLVSHDIAVLKIDVRPSLCLPLGVVSSQQVSDEVISLGYPGSDRLDNQQLGFYPGKIFRFRDDGKIETDAVRGGGQSGGPLYHYNTKRVVGVVVEHYWSKEVQQLSENKLVTAPPKVLAGLAVQLEPLFARWSELESINGQVVKEWDKRLEQLGVNIYHRPEIDFPNLDHFRGRTDKVNELTEKLTKPTKVRVLLTGMGGVGKTFLAYYVIKNLEGLYPEGQIYLDLRGYAPKNQPPLTVEEALSSLIRQFYPNDATGQVKEELRTRWREITKNKRMLLFLDNADDEKLLEALSLDYETCTMVITSRRVLSVRFLRISLEPMLPEEAVVFLLEFANFQQPDRLTETQAKRLAELCGYLPLALDIVAKTIDTEEALDIEQYLTALATEKQRLRRLRNDDASVSVEASLNLSIEKVQPDLVRLWQILGVFVGSFDEYDVYYSKLWQIDQSLVNESLSKLVKRSLVQFIPTKSGQKRPHYGLHDLLRDIALQRLEKEEFALQRDYAVYYRDILVEAGRRYKEVDNLQGLKLFDEVQANILAAHAWVEKHFTEEKSIAQDAIHYPLSGVECLKLRLTAQTRIEWLNTGIAAAEHLKSQSLIDSAEAKDFRDNYAKLFINLGTAYDESQRAEEAVMCHQKALELAREMNNSELEMFCLNNLAVTYQALGQLNEAAWYYQKALQHACGMEQKEEELICLVNLATVYEELRGIDRAIKYAEEALNIAKSLKHLEGIAKGYCNLGNLEMAIGKYDDALENYQASLKYFDQIGDSFGKGILMDSTARLWVDKEDYLEAIKWSQEGVKIGEELNNHRILSECNSALALAYLFSGDLKTARTTVETALTYKPSRSNHQILALKGIIAFGQKEYVVAKKSFEEALRQSNELLERNSQNYQAQETKELSLGGLGLCENDKSICLKVLEKLSQPSPTSGLVKRIQRLFHKLIELSE
ncbi:MAG: hypothetical protein BWK78_02730 [Thiotrichaceae bacterium IS1]|nr:MAG: hypothetical protein BWK78_02730 [Thiotrichaceae bacterium IS1]